MPKAMDIAEFTLPVEDLLRPFAGHTKRLRKSAEEFDDLGDMVIVFAVFGSGLRIEKIVTSDQFKDLI